jgi:hypothetical protein
MRSGSGVAVLVAMFVAVLMAMVVIVRMFAFLVRVIELLDLHIARHHEDPAIDPHDVDRLSI